MAKKKAASEFNMSKAISEALSANPKSTSQEVMDTLVAKYPSAKINTKSFSVAFYTGRKKLGIASSGRGRKTTKTAKTASSRSVDFNALQSAAKFLSEVGGADAALTAIKQVQALQM